MYKLCMGGIAGRARRLRRLSSDAPAKDVVTPRYREKRSSRVTTGCRGLNSSHEAEASPSISRDARPTGGPAGGSPGLDYSNRKGTSDRPKNHASLGGPKALLFPRLRSASNLRPGTDAAAPMRLVPGAACCKLDLRRSSAPLPRELHRGRQPPEPISSLGSIPPPRPAAMPSCRLWAMISDFATNNFAASGGHRSSAAILKRCSQRAKWVGRISRVRA